MIVMVDVEKQDLAIDGFGYTNKYDQVETVQPTHDGDYSDPYFDICASDGSTATIYYEDIPKLIKALEAIKKHKEKFDA